MGWGLENGGGENYRLGDRGTECSGEKDCMSEDGTL